MIIPQTGWILFGGGKLYCLNKAGSAMWTYNMTVTQSPAVDTLKNIYFAYNSSIISLDSTGTFRWQYDSPHGDITTPITISNTCVLYFGTEMNKFVALQNSGNTIFSIPSFGTLSSAPTIDYDATIFLASYNLSTNKSKIVALSPDGNQVNDWEITLNEPHASSVIIGDSNYIYVRTMNFWGGGFGNLYKINKSTQAIQWSYFYGPDVGGNWDPTISSDGTIYLTLANGWGGNTGRFLAIDCNGNLKWELDLLSATGIEIDPLFHLVPGNAGVIYGTGIAQVAPPHEGTYLIAIHAPDALLATSAWPMHKHDENFTSLASNTISAQPDILVEKMIIDFGYTQPGNTTVLSLSVFNIGNAPLTMDWTLESAVFNFGIIPNKNKNQPFSETIQPGDSLLFSITFSPVDTAMYADTLFLISNDPDQPVSEIELKGKSTIEGDVQWNIQLSDHLSSPAIDDHGNIYVAGSNEIWRIRKTGEIAWEYQTDTKNTRSYDANISLSANNCYLYLPRGNTILALDSAGNKQWDFDPPPDDLIYGIAINQGGQLFFSESFMNGGGHFYCTNNQGEEIWHSYLGYNLSSAPAIEKGGNIISTAILGNQGKVFQLDKTNGDILWEYPFIPTTSVSIGEGNQIYVGGMWGGLGNYLPKVRGYNTSGTLLWEYDIQNESYMVSSAIVSHPNGSLIFATSDVYNGNGTICALDAEGNFLWENQYNNMIYTSPAIANNGLIYFGCAGGNFYALYPDGSERWKINTDSEILSSPTITASGMIYFTTEDGFLYAVYGENGGLANSPWPMIQHDPKHTSSADSTVVAIEESYPSTPETFPIAASPNPFKQETTISWQQHTSDKVLVKINAVSGIEIKSANLRGKPGINNYTWNGLTTNGKETKPGVYICTIKIGSTSTCIKLLKSSR